MVKKRNKIILIIVVIVVALLVQHIYAAYFAFFEGKVIDSEAKQPIEGAAVVAVWYTERMTVAGGGGGIGEVKEIFTDKNGEWRIRGASGRDIASGLLAIVTGYGTCFLAGTAWTKPPQFIIFKPGCCAVPKGDMLEPCKRMKLNYVGGKKILELPKLTNRKDRILNLPSRGDGLEHGNFQRLVEEESRYLGLGVPKY